MTYEYNPYTLGNYNLAWSSDQNSVTDNSDDINSKEEDVDYEAKDTNIELIEIWNNIESKSESQSNFEQSKFLDFLKMF